MVGLNDVLITDPVAPFGGVKEVRTVCQWTAAKRRSQTLPTMAVGVVSIHGKHRVCFVDY